MNEVIDFETYLIISQEKFEIHLLDIKNFKILYKKEINFKIEPEKINLNLLSNFLEKNFVNIINVVIENKSILNIHLSIKKKNYLGNITSVFLENTLSDINVLFHENYNKSKLMHMLINKYTIDGISYSKCVVRR